MPKAHILGIGGEGWSWIAKVLLESGWDVSGCDAGDIANNKHIQELLKLGLSKVYLNNSPNHVTGDLDYFLYTSGLLSYPKNMEELTRANELGVKSLDRNHFFPVILDDRNVVAVAGTHGKTTTSAMVAYLFDSMGDKCGFGIGGTLLNFATNGRVGESKNFVVEADEFGNAFLGLTPQIVVLTHLENDHTDYFKSFNDMLGSYRKFVNQVKKGGQIIGFGDNPGIERLVLNCNKDQIFYGFEPYNNCVLSKVTIKDFTTLWEFKYQNVVYKAQINFPGIQYALNATASVLACNALGYDINTTISHLPGFMGTARRFEKFVKGGVTYISDYGHHPTEIATTITGAKNLGKRLIVVFEPHQYKRCADLLDNFKGIFADVDILIQTDIFASRENPPYPITNEDFFKVTKIGVKNFKCIKDYKDVSDYLLTIVKRGDVVLIFAVGHGEKILDGIKRNQKTVTIMGLGINGGGLAATKYFAKKGYKVTVTDLKTSEQLSSSLKHLKLLKVPIPITYHLGSHQEKDFTNTNLVIRNPGVPQDSPYLKMAQEAGVEVRMQEGIFFKNCPTKNIIGVTGTKGKTTTSYLIYEILKANGLRAHLAGNMQIGVLDVLSKIKKDDWVVLELSSWQCEALDDVKMSPKVAVITNIYPDHLNRYKSYKDYALSKSSIFKYQNSNDAFITVKDGEFTKEYFNFCPSQKIVFDKDSFAIPKPILAGEHNILNIMASLRVAKYLNLNTERSIQAVCNFKGVPYRQELIGQIGGVDFINDTTATNPTASKTAIETFLSKKPVVILGGADKGLDVTDLASFVITNHVDYVFLKGAGTDKLIKAGLDSKLIFNDFDKVISSAFIKARNKEGIVLLSPGCASFGMFVNEFDRGDKFNAYFTKLKRLYGSHRLPKMDSRQIKKGDIFVAIKGTKIDGNKFIEQAITNGAKTILGEDISVGLTKIYPEINFVVVNNPRQAFSDLCANHFGNPQDKIKIIGVTGTDGKTTTCHFIYSILKEVGYKVALVSTVSSPGLHTTTPDADVLFKLLANHVKKGYEYCVLETTSHALEQNRIGPIKFVVSCITNVTPEHLDAHKTYRNYLKTKAKIISRSQAVYLNPQGAGFSLLSKITSNLRDLTDLKLIKTNPIKGLSSKWVKKFPGDYNKQNAVCASSVCAYLGIFTEDISKGLEKAIPPTGRFEMVKNKLGINIVVDFAHTPNALNNLLLTVSKIKNKESKIVCVFGCAGERDKYKRPKMGETASRYCDKVILTAEDPRSESVVDIINEMALGDSNFDFIKEPDRKKAIAKAIKLAKKGDWVLVCGKGHEKSLNIGGKEIPWNDKNIINKLLKSR
ncbi:UDP-N-acetylmuramoyl-L-alanyl-D-glutamate--2,6-diaminopimelate ligase [Candidatus Parcubacteria bacterium]|nr:UDP-N-acetylmuramoyl-L-alanyl-D-glutamate--2,6-diaminopimelate ligase [Patescibacteria group bacterium]MCG2688832.1 UDP-N-acetylmuramoyl-L-alanyl-D-glutamate--2,6-diaminopimelate ligase [Candidatus Parcubacteria bacterium]